MAIDTFLWIWQHEVVHQQFNCNCHAHPSHRTNTAHASNITLRSGTELQKNKSNLRVGLNYLYVWHVAKLCYITVLWPLRVRTTYPQVHGASPFLTSGHTHLKNSRSRMISLQSAPHNTTHCCCTDLSSNLHNIREHAHLTHQDNEARQLLFLHANDME